MIVDWDALTDLERVTSSVVDEMVEHCEMLLAEEVKAWRATTLAARLLQKQTDAMQTPTTGTL